MSPTFLMSTNSTQSTKAPSCPNIFTISMRLPHKQPRLDHFSVDIRDILLTFQQVLILATSQTPKYLRIQKSSKRSKGNFRNELLEMNGIELNYRNKCRYGNGNIKWNLKYRDGSSGVCAGAGAGVSSTASQPFPMRQMLMNPLLASLLASLFVLFHNRCSVLRFAGHVTFDFYDVCRRPDRFRKCIDERIFDIMGGDCIGYSSQLGLKRVNKPILQFEMDIFDYEREMRMFCYCLSFWMA